MSEVMIARFKNKKEADFASRLIKKHVKSSRLITGSNLEDLYLGEMIDEGIKAKSNLSTASFKKYLERRINK